MKSTICKPVHNLHESDEKEFFDVSKVGDKYSDKYHFVTVRNN